MVVDWCLNAGQVAKIDDAITCDSTIHQGRNISVAMVSELGMGNFVWGGIVTAARAAVAMARREARNEQFAPSRGHVSPDIGNLWYRNIHSHISTKVEIRHHSKPHIDNINNPH